MKKYAVVVVDVLNEFVTGNIGCDAAKAVIEPIAKLRELIPNIMHHHERFDGKGYPDGLEGERIPLFARIICIADSFDAMTTDRPYRRGLTLEQAIYELKKNASKQFDPILVETFIKMIETGKLDTLSLENRPSL